MKNNVTFTHFEITIKVWQVRYFWWLTLFPPNWQPLWLNPRPESTLPRRDRSNAPMMDMKDLPPDGCLHGDQDEGPPLPLGRPRPLRRGAVGRRLWLSPTLALTVYNPTLRSGHICLALQSLQSRGGLPLKQKVPGYSYIPNFYRHHGDRTIVTCYRKPISVY